MQALSLQTPNSLMGEWEWSFPLSQPSLQPLEDYTSGINVHNKQRTP